ncbi:MAG: methylmalonyl-CoA epimerase [Rhodospirillaceae bacterium]|nr:methylmalonyl-CoA epimerase [Rhodospirillaceae bacterium]|tara:strand:- start:1490 stop:1894 length:405 start_codon:yes stop_codon:yes gene_type:complete
MIGQLNHVAIAVSDIKKASNFYHFNLGADISELHELPEHGVQTVFVDLQNTKIELITPLGENSPIKAFLEKNPEGGIHHVCYEVLDINKATKKLSSEGYRILGDGQPKIGAHGKPVIFLHPKDCFGCLIELEEK